MAEAAILALNTLVGCLPRAHINQGTCASHLALFWAMPPKLENSSSRSGPVINPPDMAEAALLALILKSDLSCAHTEIRVHVQVIWHCFCQFLEK